MSDSGQFPVSRLVLCFGLWYEFVCLYVYPWKFVNARQDLDSVRRIFWLNYWRFADGYCLRCGYSFPGSIYRNGCRCASRGLFLPCHVVITWVEEFLLKIILKQLPFLLQTLIHYISFNYQDIMGEITNACGAKSKELVQIIRLKFLIEKIWDKLNSFKKKFFHIGTIQVGKHKHTQILWHWLSPLSQFCVTIFIFRALVVFSLLTFIQVKYDNKIMEQAMQNSTFKCAFN